MTPGSLPRRYARALFELAEEEDALEAYVQALQGIVRALQEAPGALEALASRSAELASRVKVMEEIASQTRVPNTLGRFLLLVVRRDRAALLPEIVREFSRLCDAALNVARVTIRTPESPAVGVLRRVEELLGAKLGKKIRACGRADASLIGGLVLEIENTVYDGSVRRELERLRDRMIRERPN